MLYNICKLRNKSSTILIVIKPCDDLHPNRVNMHMFSSVLRAQVDSYGTVQPHTLIRQYMDYKHWYDRTKLTLKEIQNVMFASSMNPTAGSFTIDSRLQRHFYVFALG